MSLETVAASWMEQAARRDAAFYEAEWDVSRCGKTFPLRQHMSIETQHSILSVKTGLGKVGVSAEFCYFDVCPHLDGAALEEYCALAAELTKADVACGDRSHDYTFISLVLLTEGFGDKALQKQLKRFRIFKQYNRADGQYGWSACRICVVDLVDENLYGSALSEPLLTRLSGGVRPQPPSVLDRFRECFRR